MRINIVLPFFPDHAVGGVKVMYEYANRLSSKGHNVTIYHSVQTAYTLYEHKSHLSIFIKFARRIVQKKYKLSERPNWFKISDKIPCKRIPYIGNRFVRDADICISTWWGTVYDVMKLSKSKGERFNLIQAYETIMTNYPPQLVHDSYKLPLHHIVISKYLYDVVTLHSKDSIDFVPNGIDLTTYNIQKPIDGRSPASLIMRYSSHKYKACNFALDAYKILKEKYPNLQLILFSSEPKDPSAIPNWCTYIYGSSDIAPLYNDSAIYVSSSIDEGWPLPPMEAMACGCACVCTNIPPHLSYMIDNKNSLLVEPENTDDIVKKISYLIDNPSEIGRLAEEGVKSMKLYDWSESTNRLEDILAKHV